MRADRGRLRHGDLGIAPVLPQRGRHHLGGEVAAAGEERDDHDALRRKRIEYGREGGLAEVKGGDHFIGDAARRESLGVALDQCVGRRAIVRTVRREHQRRAGDGWRGGWRDHEVGTSTGNSRPVIICRGGRDPVIR